MSDNPARVRMQIELPAETWLESFCFIPRRQVASVVCYVCCYFSRIAHKLLHKQGKIMLGKLCFKEGENGEAEVHLRRNRRVKVIVPFPEVAMPNNIVGFDRIKIKFIDGQVIAMLDKMRALFANVNCLKLDVDYVNDVDETEEWERMLRMLKEICPLLGTVNFVNLNLGLPNGIIELGRISPSLLAGSTSMHIECFEEIHVPAICDWLTVDNSGEEDRTHKFLTLGFGDQTDALAIMDQLIEEFLASTRPAPFFVGFRVILKREFTIDNFKLHNPATDENLQISEGPSRSPLSLVIVRYARRDVPDEGKWAEWLGQQWEQLDESTDSQTENQMVVVYVKNNRSTGGGCCIL